MNKHINRRKFILLYVLAVTVLSLMVLGLGRWLIVPMTTSSPKQPSVDPGMIDTSPAFTSSGVYNGGLQEPVLTDDGKAIFGENYTRDDTGETGTGYRIEYVTGDYFLAGLGGGDNKTTIIKEKDKGVAAGTHYYKITDNTTGQVICNYHQVKIGKQSVSVDTIANKVGFVGDELTWTVKLSGSEDKVALDSFNYSYKVLLSDYGTGGKQSATTAHSSTTNVVSKTKSLSDYVSEHYSFEEVPELNNNYSISSTLTFTVKAEILPTTRTNENTTTYYGTLVAALNATETATSSVNVIPMQSFVYTPSGGSQTTYKSGTNYHHVISEDCIVGAKVTLAIPYDIAETNISKTTPTQSTATGALKYGTASRTNLVTVTDDVELTSNGTILIQAVVSGAQNGLHGSGITNGLHSQISLGANSGIVANGKIYCYGFIDGDETSTVEMQSGEIVTVYTVIEHRGGTVFSNMAGGMIQAALNPDLKTSPFNRFYIASIISAKVIVSESATLVGYADLVANSSHNTTTIKLIGNTNSYFVQLKSGSSVEATFKPGMVKNDAGTTTYGQNDVDIYGNITINALSLKVSGATLSTEKVHFPLSHYWNVSLNRAKGSNATVTVDSSKQDIKLWPKAVLTIGEGVVLQADSIVVYSGTDEHNAGLNESGSGTRTIDVKGAATMDIAGTLSVNTFGGTVNPISSQATIVINTSATNSIKELKQSDSDPQTYYDITFVAQGNILTGPTTVSSQNLGVTTYYASAYSGGYAWLNHTANITLNANGGTVSPESITVDIGTGGIADITPITNIVPTLTDYKFMGWYLDENLTTAFNSTMAQSIKYDSTLYAKWELSKTVTVHFETYGGTAYDDITVTLTPSGISLADFNKIDGKIPTLSNHRFDGWFMDSEFTSPVSQTSIPNSASEITVYALWTEIEGQTYNVSFDLNSEGKTGVSEVEFGDTPAAEGTFEVPNTNKTVASDMDISVQYYLAGWSTDPNAETGSFTFEITADTTLYAVWRTKASLTLDVSGNTGLGLANDPSVWLKPGQSYDVAQFDNYSKLHGGDDNTANNKYYEGGFVVDEAKLAISGTTVTVMAGVDDTALAVTPAWKDKVKFTVDYGTHGTGELGLANETAYLKPRDTYTVTKDLTTGDSNTSISKYYYGSWTLSGVTLSTSDGIVFTVTATSGNATAIVDWATKTKVTIDYGEYGNGTLEFSDETLWVKPDATFGYSGDVTKANASVYAESFEKWVRVVGQIEYDDVELTSESKFKNTWGGENVTLLAKWVNKPYSITYVSDGTNNGVVEYYLTTQATLIETTRDGQYKFKGWYSAASGGNKIGDSGDGITNNAHITLYAQWTEYYVVTFDSNGGNAANPSTVQVDAGNAIGELPTVTRDRGWDGTKYTFNGWYTDKSSGTQISDSYEPTGNVTLYAQWTEDGGCIAEGTLITLADGTRKAVEDLTYDDEVLIFNHHTGQIEVGHIAMLDHLGESAEWNVVVNLEFSNGEVLRIIWNHGLFDVTLNEYVFINARNAQDYVGHQFYSSVYTDGVFTSELVTLENAYVTEEYISVYNPTTAWHMNYFASGILNVTAAPDVVSGHMNYFELDSNMKYDEVKMMADIEKYGLYTYDDFKEYLTFEQYSALPFEYLKVSVGKGMITWDGIISIIDYLKQGALLPE
ncbi:MAG: InlB B-repeat-containing protein [Clostridia bacterium]|nr:InlB B-repeat-containing protein [Clostridia bacterium]